MCAGTEPTGSVWQMGCTLREQQHLPHLPLGPRAWQGMAVCPEANGPEGKGYAIFPLRVKLVHHNKSGSILSWLGNREKVAPQHNSKKGKREPHPDETFSSELGTLHAQVTEDHDAILHQPLCCWSNDFFTKLVESSSCGQMNFQSYHLSAFIFLMDEGKSLHLWETSISYLIQQMRLLLNEQLFDGTSC